MSPFLSPAKWEDAIRGKEGLLPIDRFICALLWNDREPTTNIIQVRQKRLAKSAGISSRHLRGRLAELERLRIIQRLGSDNDGTTLALVGGNLNDDEDIPPEGRNHPPQSSQRGRNQRSENGANQSRQDGVSGVGMPPRQGAQFRPPEEYKNITPTLEPITPNLVPVPTNLKSPPSPLIVPPNATNGTDLLGLPLADDEDALLREAVETWLHWQAKLGKRKRIINLTPKRARRFAALFRGPLRRSMTAWRKICRACTRNALLAGVEGRWDGATFDWIMLEENATRILRGDFAEDFDPAPPVTA